MDANISDPLHPSNECGGIVGGGPPHGKGSKFGVNVGGGQCQTDLTTGSSRIGNATFYNPSQPAVNVQLPGLSQGMEVILTVV